MTENGRKALMGVEAFRAQVYDDGAGILTIGFGHRLTAEDIATNRFANGITYEDASALLELDIAPAAAAVKRLVKVPLNSNQEDALTIFAFNVGIGTAGFSGSTLLKKLNTGGYESVPAELRRWVYANGKKMNGLVNRRELEIGLWLGVENGSNH